MIASPKCPKTNNDILLLVSDDMGCIGVLIVQCTAIDSFSYSIRRDNVQNLLFSSLSAPMISASIKWDVLEFRITVRFPSILITYRAVSEE